MRAVPMRKVVVAGVVAAAACGLLLTTLLPSSASVPGARVDAASISPLAMMAQAPRDLPVEQYDTH